MRAMDMESSIAIQFANILCATDLSPASEKGLEYAIEIARRYRSKIYSVHAIEQRLDPLVPAQTSDALADEQAEWRSQCRAHLERRLQGIPHESIFRTGQLWPTLADVIRDKEIDLLVLGTHGRSGIEKVLLGSVAEQVFRHATCPVLSVGPGAPGKPKPTAELNRILYATDFSSESLAAVPHAISLAREHRAQLILLHCLQGGGDVPALLQTLRDVVPFRSELRCPPVCVVERGTPAAKILEVAEGHGANMIVLGVHGVKNRLAASSYFAGSATYKIVAQANCPVLTVRSE